MADNRTDNGAEADSTSANGTDDVVLVDDPLPKVRRLTLNRPRKRNALSNGLRGRLFEEMRRADLDPDISVIVLRGAGPCWSSGYDLSQDPSEGLPRHQAKVPATWPRHLVDGWFEMWDYSTVLIAQVHGYCLAGGTELATACDLVYVAEDATIGYPAVRLMSPPDMTWQPWLLGFRRAMEAVLTGDSMTGEQAAAAGFANRAVPLGELESTVLDVAQRVAQVPKQLLAINKRAVHRNLEAMGMRDGLRASTDIQALAAGIPEVQEYGKQLRANVTEALTRRDAPFADYRTSKPATD